MATRHRRNYRRSPSSVDRLLSRAGGRLGQLYQGARYIGELQEALARLIPSNLAGHCRVARFAGGVLVLLTESPTWTARLRLEGPSLVQQLSRHPAFRGLNRIEVRSRPRPECPAARPETMPHGFSPRVAEALVELSRTARNPELRRSLERLARHGGRAPTGIKHKP